jgi:hypothetical protein
MVIPLQPLSLPDIPEMHFVRRLGKLGWLYCATLQQNDEIFPFFLVHAFAAAVTS